MRKAEYRPAARADLEAIYDHIATDSPERALRFVEGIEEGCLMLCDHGLLGRARNDLAPGLRTLALRGRVVVAYRLRGEQIEVIRIFYAGQDHEAILRHLADE
jgi:toxin ParE1/3/4